MRTLSVVVLNWNGLRDTRALLPTLLACCMPPGWSLEIVVVDNGSTDGSVAALAAEFPGVKLAPLPENRRFAGGNDHGLALALQGGADAVALLNNDTRADEALFERLLLALDQDPLAGAAAPLIYYGAPSDRIWYAGAAVIPAAGLAAHRGLRARDRGQYRSVEQTGYLTGCCLLARRDVWEKVGPLDESYFIYAEDVDWCLRARAAGYRLLFVPTARLWHEVSASSGATSPWKIYQRLRANWKLFSRHARGIGRLTFAPAFLLQQAALMAWLAAQGEGAAAAAIPQALWNAWKDTPQNGAPGAAISASWARKPERAAEEPPLFLRETIAALTLGARVLDAGCGPGSWPYGERPDLQIAAFDLKFPPGPPAPAPRLGVFRADLARVPLRDATSDLTVCHYVLEHVTDLEPCCDELARVTRPGGILYLAVPRSASFDDRLYRFAGYFAKYALLKLGKRIEHQQRFDLAKARRLFESRGFATEALALVPAGFTWMNDPRTKRLQGPFTDALASIHRALGVDLGRDANFVLRFRKSGGPASGDPVVRRVSHVCRECGEHSVLTPPSPRPRRWICPWCGRSNPLGGLR